jgi:hypothetical protein
MKKIFFIILALIIFSLPINAEEDLSTGIDGLTNFTHGFDGQKQITDEEFEKTLSEVEAKQKKNKKKKPFKGQGHNQQDEFQHIKELQQEPALLNLPVNIMLNSGVKIPSGHYKVVGKKTRQDTIVEFYQGAGLVASVPVFEIENDFNENNINFIKIVPYDNEFVKLIFGSLDFNAYTFLPIEQEKMLEE